MIKENYIAGEWVGSDETIANINPSDTNDIIAHYAQASEDGLQKALMAAKDAAPKWAKTGLEARQNILQSIGEELMSRAEELGELLAREEGKTKAEGKGEVYRAGQFFTYYASEVLRQMGGLADSVRPNIEVMMAREPMGVVGVISPWNFPTATASWKIAPALAFGNAVIWKPANLTPASAWALTEIIARHDMPAGTFQLVMGSGGRIGQGLVESPLIDAVSFTGSHQTGVEIAKAAATNLTKFQLELGSKNALIVMDDADINIAVNAALIGGYSSTGQKCTASSRLLVHDRIHDEFVEKLCLALDGFQVGHALDENTKMGPVASHDQLNNNLSYIALGQDEGAELVQGGAPLSLATKGYYLSPALFINSHNQMRINQEEIFGPIAAVQKIHDYEEGLTISNDTKYGLTAGIITQSLSLATHFRRHAEAGCVMVNLPTAGTDYHVPFGGRKQSSFGSREQGQSAVEFYTQVKTSYVSSG